MITDNYLFESQTNKKPLLLYKKPKTLYKTKTILYLSL